MKAFIIGNSINLAVIMSYFFIQGQSLALLLDPGSMMFSGIPFLLFTLFRGKVLGLKDIYNFGMDKESNANDIANNLTFIRKIILFSGFLGSTIGFLIALSNFYDKSAVGPGIALMFLSLFYPFFITASFIYPLEIKTKIFLKYNSNFMSREVPWILIILSILFSILLIILGYYFDGGTYTNIFHYYDFIILSIFIISGIFSSNSTHVLSTGFQVALSNSENQNISGVNASIICDAYNYLIFSTISFGYILSVMKLLILIVTIGEPYDFYTLFATGISPIIFSLSIILLIVPIKMKMDLIYKKIATPNSRYPAG